MTRPCAYIALWPYSSPVNQPVWARTAQDHFALAFARIENHFFYHRGWFPTDAWILENVAEIRHIPTVIIQGRYDVVCPVVSAWDLAQAFPEAKFVIVEDSGHTLTEPGTATAAILAAPVAAPRL